jgi:hypothetical protein
MVIVDGARRSRRLQALVAPLATTLAVALALLVPTSAGVAQTDPAQEEPPPEETTTTSPAVPLPTDPPPGPEPEPEPEPTTTTDAPTTTEPEPEPEPEPAPPPAPPPTAPPTTEPPPRETTTTTLPPGAEPAPPPPPDDEPASPIPVGEGGARLLPWVVALSLAGWVGVALIMAATWWRTRTGEGPEADPAGALG